MYASSPRPFGRPFGVIVALLGLLSGLWTGVAAAAFTTFESGQVRPLALSPDGTRLFAVNTPDDRLEIFSLTGGAPRPHRLRPGRPRAGRGRGALEHRGVGGEPPLRLDQHRRRRRPARARHAHAAGLRRAARHRVRRPRREPRLHHHRPARAELPAWRANLTTAGRGARAGAGVRRHQPRARPSAERRSPRSSCSATRRARSRSRPAAARSTPASSTPATRPRRSPRAWSATAAPAPRRAPSAGRACRAACRLPTRTSRAMAQPEVGLIVKFNTSGQPVAGRARPQLEQRRALLAARPRRLRHRRQRRHAGPDRQLRRTSAPSCSTW